MRFSTRGASVIATTGLVSWLCGVRRSCIVSSPSRPGLVFCLSVRLIEVTLRPRDVTVIDA
jgi:hypothetical protein